MQSDVRTTTEAAGRAGLVARGVGYCLVALVALGIATGTGDGEAEGPGALQMLAGRPGGTPLLAALAVGLLGYAVWRLTRAVVEDGVVNRLRNAFGAVVHVALAATAVRILTKGDAGADQDDQARSWTARLLEHDLGRTAVIAAGAVLILVGLWLLAYAVRGRHERHLEEWRMRRWQRRWLPRLGTAGHAARGVVTALVGTFAIQAALEHDPDKAAGMDGALHRLAQQPWGPPALAGVALGLLAYGLYSFVEARWRKLVTC